MLRSDSCTCRSTEPRQQDRRPAIGAPPEILIIQQSGAAQREICAAFAGEAVALTVVSTVKHGATVLRTSGVRSAVAIVDLEFDGVVSGESLRLLVAHHVPAIILTAVDPNLAEAISRERPPYAYLRRPVAFEELRVAVRGALVHCSPHASEPDMGRGPRPGRPPGVRLRGFLLRRERERRALSREELAERAGIGDISVARAEREERVSSKIAVRLANALGLRLDDLLDT